MKHELKTQKQFTYTCKKKGRGTCEGEKHPNNKVIELMSKRITIGS
jgi:hypothetical protein